ncbi:putative HTH-type transcriptional regulator YdcR [compost metagenome]
MQLALVDYLATKRYDTHLRKLRRILAERKQQTWQALHQHFPVGVKIHHSESGYFLWIELPQYMDASILSEQAIAQKISIAPGKMFTTGGAWHNYFRLNASWALGERERHAVLTLANLIRQNIKE